MSMTLPGSLLLLLETPLAEELYLDWACLLETIVVNYPPPPTHLLLCMTIMAHASSEYNDTLKATCHRILLKTLTRHGPRAFKQVLDFDPEELGRNKRRKVRHTESDIDGTVEAGELVDLKLTTSESLCVVFSNLWECLACAFRRRDGNAAWWHHLSDFICILLQEDWQTCVEAKMDLTKTILVQHLRVKGERRVELKQVLKCLLTDASVPEDTVLDTYRAHINGKNVSIEQKNESQQTEHTLPALQTMRQRRKLLSMIYHVSTVPRLNVVLESEVTSTLANLIAPLPVRFITSFFSFRPLNDDECRNAVPSLCNALLFRLAAYPGKTSKAGERHVDWAKVQGWCASPSRSIDEFEIVKVSFFIYVLFLAFTTQPDVDLPTEEKTDAANVILSGIESAQVMIEKSMESKRSRWGYAKLATPEELEDTLVKLKQYVLLLIASFESQ